MKSGNPTWHGVYTVLQSLLCYISLGIHGILFGRRLRKPIRCSKCCAVCCLRGWTTSTFNLNIIWYNFLVWCSVANILLLHQLLFGLIKKKREILTYQMIILCYFWYNIIISIIMVILTLIWKYLLFIERAASAIFCRDVLNISPKIIFPKNRFS